MPDTTTVYPDADIAGDWQGDTPVAVDATDYTEPTLLGFDSAAYAQEDSNSIATTAFLELPEISNPPASIEFIGAGSLDFAETARTTATVPFHASTAVGDLVEVILATQEDAGSDPGDPTIADSSWTRRYTILNGAAYKPHLTKWWKFVDSSDVSAGEVTIDIPTGVWPGGVWLNAISKTWRNVNTEEPYDVVAQGMNVGTTGSNPNPWSVTVVTDGSVVTATVWGNREAGTSAANASAGYTTSVNQADGRDRAFVDCHKTVQAGVQDPGPYSWPNVENWGAVSDVLKPAGGAVQAIVVASVVDDTETTQMAGTDCRLAARNEIQVLSDEGLSGTFTLTFQGQTTAAIAQDAGAAAVQSALEALSNVTSGDVLCSGGPLDVDDIRIEFAGNYAETYLALLTSGNSDLGITRDRPGSAEQNFTLQSSVNVPRAGSTNEPQLHYWSAEVTNYIAGRELEVVVADHDALNSWATILLVVENTDSDPLQDIGAKTNGESTSASFATVTPSDEGAKIVSVVAKALASGFYSGSVPTPNSPSGYQTIADAIGDRTTLSVSLSSPVDDVAQNPSNASWSGSNERWTSSSFALTPLTPATSLFDLHGVVDEVESPDWLEIAGAAGNMYEVFEFDLSSLPAAAVITGIALNFAHSSPVENSLRATIVGINDDDTIVTATEQRSGYVPGSQETEVETVPWTELSDGQSVTAFDRFGVAFISTEAHPSLSTHKIHWARAVVEYEAGGPVVSNVAGPATAGDPVTWDYTSDSGLPMTHYRVVMARGNTGFDPDTATVAANPLEAVAGEIFFDSGRVASGSARELTVTGPLSRGDMEVSVKAWARLSSGLLVESDWVQDDFNISGGWPDGIVLDQLHFDNFGSYSLGAAEGQLSATDWSLYDDDNGHAGWGVRRRDAITIASDVDANNGQCLLITATNGTGADAGKLSTGGLALKKPQTYGRYEVRVKIAADPDEVTSGVCIVWPTEDNFPEGDRNPAGGELDFWESDANNRDTRYPMKAFIHRLNPDAVKPYIPRGEPNTDDEQFEYDYQRSGTVYRKLVFDWWKDELRLQIDNEADPVILTPDPAWIPDWDCELTLQLDPFPAPSTPTTQPAVTGGNTPTMSIDYVLVSSYGPDPVFNQETGVVEMTVAVPSGVTRAWLLRSDDVGATWELTPNSPIDVTASADNVLEDTRAPLNADTRWKVSFDSGEMSETSIPDIVGSGSISTATTEWFLMAVDDPSLTTQIEVADVSITRPKRSVQSEQAGRMVVANSKEFGARIDLTIRTRDKGQRDAVDAVLEHTGALRLADIWGRDWTVRQISDVGQKPQRWAPLPTETSGLRDAHELSVTFGEVEAT